MTSASRDPALNAIKDEFGMAGYGAYWAILEAIAEQMTPENDDPKLQLSVKNWRKITEFSPKKFKLFVAFLEKNGLFDVDINDTATTITCSNLLKVRDEYAKKSARKKNDISRHSPEPFNSASNSASSREGIIIVQTGEVPDYGNPAIRKGVIDHTGTLWKYNDGVLVNSRTGKAHVDPDSPLEQDHDKPF